MTKISRMCFLMLLRLICRLFVWSNPTKVSYTETIMFVLDVQSTGQKNICQATHEQQAENVPSCVHCSSV